MPTLVDVLRYSAVRYSVVCPYTSLTADNSEIAMHNPSAITDGAMARYGLHACVRFVTKQVCAQYQNARLNNLSRFVLVNIERTTRDKR